MLPSILIKRLRQYSETLDKMQLFVGIPWILIDSRSNKQTYIFSASGDLIMSLNGLVTIGKWEYLPQAKRLLIDRIADKILLQQDFINPAVMILRKDGSNDENIILANENILQELTIQSIEDYLKKLFYKKSGVILRKIKDGRSIEVHNCTFDEQLNYKKITMNGEDVQNGELDLEVDGIDRKLVVQGSLIIQVLVMEEFETDKGPIVVERPEYTSIHKGNSVFKDNLPAPDGKYHLAFLRNIKVKNGRLV